MSDNDWYEKGELPPVGTECMVFNHDLGKTAAWEKCTILYVGKFKCVYDSESCHERVGDVDTIGKLEFKPIKSKQDQERDEFVNQFLSSDINVTGTRPEIASALFDAGYRKVKPLSNEVLHKKYQTRTISELFEWLLENNHIVSEGE